MVTLPRIQSRLDVDILVDTFDQLEDRLDIEHGALRVEFMVETTQSIFDPQGRAMLPRLHHATNRPADWLGTQLALHTHVNHAQQLTPLVGKAVRKLLDMGFRDVRNQGVLLRGVNATPKDLLELCFTLLDHAQDPAVLLLHVRHDPQLRALAASRGGGAAAPARHHGLPAGLRHAAHRL